jgi:hypothetical protein
VSAAKGAGKYLVKTFLVAVLRRVCAPGNERTKRLGTRTNDVLIVCRNGARLVITVLDKELRRQVTVDGVDYTIALDLDGFRLTGKGKRRPEVEMRWQDLLSGDAAIAAALNASLKPRRVIDPAIEKSPKPATNRVRNRPPP